MKKVFAIIVSLISLSFMAAEVSAGTVTREYGLTAFDGLKANNRFDVELERSSGYSMTITVPEEFEQYVKVEVDDGTLVLGLNYEALPKTLKRLFDKNDWTIEAKVRCPEINRIRLSGAAKLTMADGFSSTSLEIRTSGASSIDRAVLKGGGRLQLQASGASHVELELSGNYPSADIKCSGASNVYIEGGQYDKCYVDNSGASNVDMLEMNFSDLNVELSGASNITMSGTAQYLSLEARGASSCSAASFKVERARVIAGGASGVTVNARYVESSDISSASTFINRR